MSDRGIIFSAPMIRALLDGRKTQTRRLLNPQPDRLTVGFQRVFAKAPYFEARNAQGRPHFGFVKSPVARTAYPTIHYGVGDRLYVLESCRAEELEGDGRDGVRFSADGAFIGIAHTMTAAADWSKLFYYRGRGKGRIGNAVPSIHMPRWASRMWLAVTEVRVQRLQDISEADAIAEGLGPDPDGFFGMDPRGWYRDLWDSLHTEPGTRWADNPWVVAVSFDVHHGNIDVGGADV